MPVAASRNVKATKETPLGPGAAVKAPKLLIWKEVGGVQAVARGEMGLERMRGRKVRMARRKCMFRIVDE